MFTRSSRNFTGSALDLGNTTRERVDQHLKTRENLDAKHARVIHSRFFQCRQRRCARDPVPLDDSLRMDPLSNQLLRLPQQLRSQNANACGPIPDFVVLNFGNVDQDLRGCVIQLDRLQYRRPIVRDVNISCGTRLQNFVHSFGTERGFDEVAEGESTHERGETSILSLFFRRL